MPKFDNHDRPVYPGPEIEEPRAPHRKAAGGRKRFRIEVRWVDINCDKKWFPDWFYEWHTWKAYPTAKRRDQAFADLTRKADSFPHSRQEYRKVDL